MLCRQIWEYVKVLDKYAHEMHVISKVKLREFWVQHADFEDALNDWYKFVSKAKWSNLLDV